MIVDEVKQLAENENELKFLLPKNQKYKSDLAIDATIPYTEKS